MIISLNHLVDWRRKNSAKKMVLVTGCFDILHKAHKQFLEKAKQEGDVLAVGLETDERIKQMKGPGRPVNNHSIRLKNLDKLDIADFVFLLPNDLGLKNRQADLVKKLKVNVLAVSSHTAHLDRKRQIMNQAGGRVKIIMKHNPKISTSQILHQATSVAVYRQTGD